MTKHLNITKLVAVSLLAIFITASMAVAAEPETGVTCGSYETKGKYVSVSPFQCQNSDDAQINLYKKNISPTERAATSIISGGVRIE